RDGGSAGTSGPLVAAREQDADRPPVEVRDRQIEVPVFVEIARGDRLRERPHDVGRLFRHRAAAGVEEDRDVPAGRIRTARDDEIELAVAVEVCGRDRGGAVEDRMVYLAGKRAVPGT